MALWWKANFLCFWSECTKNFQRIPKKFWAVFRPENQMASAIMTNFYVSALNSPTILHEFLAEIRLENRWLQLMSNFYFQIKILQEFFKYLITYLISSHSGSLLSGLLCRLIPISTKWLTLWGHFCLTQLTYLWLRLDASKGSCAKLNAPKGKRALLWLPCCYCK